VTAGLAYGLALTVAWVAWSVPDLTDLATSAGARTGTDGNVLGVADAVSQGLRHAAAMWTPVSLAIALPAGWLAWRRR